MILFDKIKKMSLEQLAKFLTEIHCQECGYVEGDWKNCNATGCWCHKNNGYLTYSKMLTEEVKN